jgi:hypothetical protein
MRMKISLMIHISTGIAGVFGSFLSDNTLVILLLKAMGVIILLLSIKRLKKISSEDVQHHRS